jgi:hypothetical protein
MYLSEKLDPDPHQSQNSGANEGREQSQQRRGGSKWNRFC